MRVYQRIIKLKHRASRYLSMFLVIVPCVFIRVRHTYQTIVNFNWVRIKRKTPAPYSQASELVFRQNSGQQCVAMTLCSLIYSNKQGINSANDIVSIMNIGASWYLSMFLVIDPCVFIRVRHTYQTIANSNWVQI